MSLIQRVQDILLRPRTTWPVIAAEPADTASVYSSYLIFLAAIPAVAGFIGLSLIGFGMAGLGLRVPIVSGLLNMVIGYLLALGMVYVVARIVDALAPTFGGTKSPLNALKLVAYGSTASFLGGLFNLVPVLSALGLLAALYSIYLIYTGIPVLMKCPPEKAAAYTAVVIVCGVIAMVILSAVASLVLPAGPLHMRGATGVAGAGDATATPPSSDVGIGAASMAEMARKMEEAGKRIEANQQSGDGAAPIAAQELKALLPAALGDLPRESVEAHSGQALGIGGSSAKAAYAAGDRRIRLSITDIGGMGGMDGLAAMAGSTDLSVDRETNGRIEKVYKDGRRTVREEYRKDGSHGQYTTLLTNGVVVEATGERVEMPVLKKVVAQLDLARLEALKRVAKP